MSGLLVMSSISNLVMLILNLDSARTAHLSKISRFQKYSVYRKLPMALTNKIKSFYEYQWTLLGGLDEQKVGIIYQQYSVFLFRNISIFFV